MACTGAKRAWSGSSPRSADKESKQMGNTAGGEFHMSDIREKRPARRRAVAVGELQAGLVAFPLIAERRLPKGDALALAEIAGLQGAQAASSLMPLCPPLPLEMVRVRC